MTNVDLFDGLETSPADNTDNTIPAEQDSVATNVADSPDAPEAPEAAVETVSDIPDGAMGVTEFAAHLTQTFMRERFANGEDLDGSEYVQPQAVYQTVKALRDRIPHVLVKSNAESEARVYILTDPAVEWWRNRRERLATRGTGISRSASQRTPEDNMTLLANAVYKSRYAKDRLAMWDERSTDAERLVEKYKGFLADAKISDEVVAKVIQDATNDYEADQAKKLAEKESKAKKSKSDNNSEE